MTTINELMVEALEELETTGPPYLYFQIEEDFENIL